MEVKNVLSLKRWKIKRRNQTCGSIRNNRYYAIRFFSRFVIPPSNCYYISRNYRDICYSHLWHTCSIWQPDANQINYISIWSMRTSDITLLRHSIATRKTLLILSGTTRDIQYMYEKIHVKRSYFSISAKRERAQCTGKWELISHLWAAHCVRIFSHEQILNLEDTRGSLSTPSGAGNQERDCGA